MSTRPCGYTLDSWPPSRPSAAPGRSRMDLSRYTSFETSVALRDAGAPQLDGDVVWSTYASPRQKWRSLLSRVGKDERSLCRLVGEPGDVDNDEARAWRLDEILEALAESGEGIRLSGSRDGWALCTGGGVLGSGSSPVGAAAACLVAVLRSRANMKRTNKEADNGL